MTPFEIVSNTAVAVTFASFLAGLPTCTQIWKHRSTKGTSAFPFMSGFLSTTLWLNYSHQVADPSMIFINTVGFSCFFFYNLFYVAMAPKGQVLFRQYGFLTLLLSSLLYVPNLTHDHTGTSGLIACVCGLAFFASPMAQLGRILREKDVSSLPFLMILSSFACSFLWLVFGIMVNDNYIKLPNGIAVILSGFQLSLFAIFPSRKDTHNKSDTVTLLKDHTSENI